LQRRETDARFETTSWRLVRRASSSPEDLDALVRIYWSPIYAYVRRSGKRRQDALDLTQEFLTKVVLERGLIEKADPNRGRFRALLKTAIGNFLIDQARKDKPRNKLRHSSFLPTGDGPFEAAEPADDADPSDAFERQWSAAILGETLNRLERQCKEDGLASHWTAFEAVIVGPTVRGAIKIPLEQLAEELKIDSAERVSSMLQTVKRKFRRTLRDVVAETVDSEDEIEPELSFVRASLRI
jgi:RNA polymerase sigma factor (sigma-70 family)